MSVWTARCKSGYEINGKVCKHSTPRGMLMCQDCLDAEVIPSLPIARIFGVTEVLTGLGLLALGFIAYICPSVLPW